MRVLTFLDLNKNELQNARLQNLAVAPANPVVGQVFYNTAAKAIWCWSGTAWDDISGDIRDVVKATGSPITVTIASGIATIDIVAASNLTAGTMSASDKIKLDAATANNIATTLVMRDGSGNLFANIINATKVTGLAAPTNPADAATKNYVDLAVQGIKAKSSVRVATTVNIALSGIQTIDGISVVAGDRVLVKNQTTGVSNGIYIVNASIWTRAIDMSTGDARGIYCFVEEGSTQADTGWLCISDLGSDLIGTNNLNFTQFSGAGQFIGGAGLVRTGNTFDIVAADSSMTINSDSIGVKVDGVTIITTALGISVKDGSITAAKLSSGITDTTMVGGAGAILGVKFYTPVTGTTVSRTFATTVNIGGNVATTVTHNLNSRNVNVEVLDATTNEKLIVDVVAATLNTVTITASGATFSALISIIG